MTREIEDALVRGRPVVALETTLVAHGFPPPIGVETAVASEEAVRAAGAIPATIGLLDGELRVGLDRDELERLAAGETRKVGPRDLAAAVLDAVPGATTVAGTLAAARLCGIQFMATGGLGGVHRGAERSWDVSADLAELASTPACVVSSGVKSLLDVPKTLEFLETSGVPIVGYGTSTFPLFLSRDSAHAVPARADDPQHAAALCRTHWQLGRTTAVLVANPPPEELALPAAESERLIEAALAEAEAAGVTGPAVTPYVLQRVHGGSGGRSAEVNKALIVANAGLAGEIAAASAALGG
jgi:pseudouridine-5'-phosphate glycosidase